MHEEVDASAKCEQLLLASGERTRAVVVLAPDSPARGQFADCASRRGNGISFGVSYTDLSGKGRGEIIFELRRELDRGWQVSDVVHHILPTSLRALVTVR